MSKHRATSEVTISWERACPASRIQCRHSIACHAQVDRAQVATQFWGSRWDQLSITKAPLIRSRSSMGQTRLHMAVNWITWSLHYWIMTGIVTVELSPSLKHFPHLGQQLLGELSKLAHSKPCSTCRTLAPTSRWLENVSDLRKWKDCNIPKWTYQHVKQKKSSRLAHALQIVMQSSCWAEIYRSFSDIFAHHSARVLPMPELASQTPLQPSMDRKLPSSHCSPGCAWAHLRYFTTKLWASRLT